MKYTIYILVAIIFTGLISACNNAPKESPKEATILEPVNKVVEETDVEPTRTIDQDKLLDEQKAKGIAELQAKELADKKAKGLSDKQAKELAEKQAKELADLKEKQEADRRAMELANQKAQDRADKKAKELAAQLAKEATDQKAKEAEDQKSKELANQNAKEEADKKTEILKEEQATEQAESIIKKVDKNMVSKTQISTTEMIIHGKRNSRTIRSKGYTKGDEQSFSEYLSPAKEKGTKMLKLKDRLWIYSPDTDRSIQLSGHMLKQSVMGSDLSYEDMMEDRKLTEMYKSIVTGEKIIDGRACWILELTAKVDDVSYDKRKIWVDKTRYVPLKEELYAKSGQLLKKTTMKDIQKIDGRWYPQKMNFKDMLKSGKGTDFVILEIEFDADIPAHIFSKASLKK